MSVRNWQASSILAKNFNGNRASGNCYRAAQHQNLVYAEIISKCKPRQQKHPPSSICHQQHLLYGAGRKVQRAAYIKEGNADRGKIIETQWPGNR